MCKDTYFFRIVKIKRAESFFFRIFAFHLLPTDILLSIMNQRFSHNITILLLFISFIGSAVSAWAQTEVSVPKNNLKMTLLSLGSGSSRFSYERAFNDHQSAEITIGVIGWGWDILNNSNPQGYIVKIAPKWNIHHVGKVHHALSGFYLKPELMYANYDYNFTADNIINNNTPIENSPKDEPYEQCHTNQLALMAEGGFQIVANWFVFDIYTGLGPTLGNGNKNNYYHGFMRFPSNGPLAFTAGFRVGFAF